MNAVQTILIFFLLYMMLMYLSNNDDTIIENWEIYNSSPYGEVKVGAFPLKFYNYPRYRIPYMWPARHITNYPTIHPQHLDIQMY